MSLQFASHREICASEIENSMMKTLHTHALTMRQSLVLALSLLCKKKRIRNCRSRGDARQRLRLTALQLATASLTLAITPPLVPGQAGANVLGSLGTVITPDAVRFSLSFPAKVLISRRGGVYVLDTELSNLFMVDPSAGKMNSLCKPTLPGRPTDVAIDSRGNVWVLYSSGSEIVRLSPKCSVLGRFRVSALSIKLQINSFGELVVLVADGPALFNVYNMRGKLIRSFGRRHRYTTRIADIELSDGHLLADSRGGIYFSFNYPPLIQHYNRQGRLLAEFKPPGQEDAGPPAILSHQEGRYLFTSPRYRIAVLDAALDARGRLYLLLSGQPKAEALAAGASQLAVVTREGKLERDISLGERFHALTAGAGSLYLLRNRPDIKLVKYLIRE